MKVTIIEYLDLQGKSPFERWFNRLDAQAAARISKALYQMEHGNFSNVKSVGKGVYEYKIYFGQNGDEFIILVGGGSKKRQSKDIIEAQDRWIDYKKRKKLKEIK